MQLFLNATSPYARLVRVAVIERGLAEAVALRWCDPWADDAALLVANPAGRVPALVTADGTALTESVLIAFYLDSLPVSIPSHSLSPWPARLIPDARRVTALHLAGLGQAIMDAAFHRVIARHHHGRQSDQGTLGKRRQAGIVRVLSRLEATSDTLPSDAGITLGELSVGVALDYLLFRLPDIAWTQTCPRLYAWHTKMLERDSFRQTVPPG